MAILVDGGSNPSAITYNGTSLHKVICNGTTVWADVVGLSPPTIDYAVISGGNNTTYLTNGTRGPLHTFSQNGVQVKAMEYSFDAVVELNTVKQRTIGTPFVTSSTNIMTVPLRDDGGLTVQGLPDGLEVYGSDWVTGQTLSCYVQTQESAVINFNTLSVETRDCQFWLYYGWGGQATMSVYAESGDFCLYEFPNGWIYQGPLTVYLKQA